MLDGEAEEWRVEKEERHFLKQFKRSGVQLIGHMLRHNILTKKS